MTSNQEDDQHLIGQCSEKLITCKDALEMLRLKCLQRGAKGIKSLARTFRIMDDNGNGQLDFTEFRQGISDYGLHISEEITKELFDNLDKDDSGSVDLDEFLKTLRDVSDAMLDIMKAAFKKADITGDGIFDCKDLSDVYNVEDHPKYRNGEWNTLQVYKSFLDRFDPNEDGKITEEEFINYYAGVSASIDDDSYFELMMKNSWKI